MRGASQRSGVGRGGGGADSTHKEILTEGRLLTGLTQLLTHEPMGANAWLCLC